MNQHRLPSVPKRAYLAPESEEVFISMTGLLCVSGEDTESYSQSSNSYGDADFE